jgi:hypothetical protein
VINGVLDVHNINKFIPVSIDFSGVEGRGKDNVFSLK